MDHIFLWTVQDSNPHPDLRTILSFQLNERSYRNIFNTSEAQLSSNEYPGINHCPYNWYAIIFSKWVNGHPSKTIFISIHIINITIDRWIMSNHPLLLKKIRNNDPPCAIIMWIMNVNWEKFSIVIIYIWAECQIRTDARFKPSWLQVRRTRPLCEPSVWLGAMRDSNPSLLVPQTNVLSANTKSTGRKYETRTRNLDDISILR